MADADRCVMCGEIIPEGSQVCTKCSAQTKTKPTTLYAIKHKQSGRLVTGTDFRYSPHRQILSDYQSPLLFTGYNLLHEIQHRQVSLRYYTVVGVTIQEV